MIIKRFTLFEQVGDLNYRLTPPTIHEDAPRIFHGTSKAIRRIYKIYYLLERQLLLLGVSRTDKAGE